MTGRLWRAGTLVCSLGLCLATQAGRPLQTEDADVLDARACELEGAWARLDDNAAPVVETALALICGFGWNSQAGVAAGTARSGDESTRNALLGGKTRLWRDADDGPALTLAWLLRADQVGGRWQHGGTNLTLVGTLPAPQGYVHLNLEHHREVADHQSATRWAMAYEHRGIERNGMNWAPMAELFGSDRSAAWWNLGLRWTAVADRVFFDLSYGRQLGDGKASLTTAGFKLAF